MPPQHRPSPIITQYGQSNGHRRQDGYAAPSADDRREMKLIEELRDLGYCIAVSCLICGQPLTAAKSVALMVGPRCRVKVLATDG